MENTNDFLRVVSNDLFILPCDGKEKLADAKDIFNKVTFRISDKPSVPTTSTPIEVCTLVRDASFERMFTFLTKDLSRLCLTESQIVSFCRKYQRRMTFHVSATSFLLNKDEQKPFNPTNLVVAHIVHQDNKLLVYKHDFMDKGIWKTNGIKYQVVVPKIKR